VERDARYAAVALFALAAIAAAFAFVWWYSGKGDRRVYDRYEIYFDGSVSGLAQGSPVRYLGVDVGRVQSLVVGRDDPGRVKVVVDIDSKAPVSGATQARLGLLGLTGLLYIDLQVNPDADPDQRLREGERHFVIPARKGDIEAFLERLPDLVGHAGSVLARIEKLLADENLAAVSESVGNLQAASGELPGLLRDAAAVATELRNASAEATALTRRLSAMAGDSQQGVVATLASAQATAERLASTTASLERIVTGNEAALAGLAGTGTVELQQLLIDARSATTEVRELARALRERPSSLVREPKEQGVEIGK
jgi:phospholipid/cholesterol/gamma-HCH transport system substrate-binding protein